MYDSHSENSYFNLYCEIKNRDNRLQYSSDFGDIRNLDLRHQKLIE